MQQTNRQAVGGTPMLQTNRQAVGGTPMLQTHIPFSRLVFKLAGRKMRAYWCAEGKKPMCVVLHFISITNKKYDEDKHAKTVWALFKQHFSERIDGYDVTDIAGLKSLLKILPHVHGFAKHNAVPFRSDLLSTLTAFENGDTSMIEDLGENAEWPADTPFSAMPVLINTTNRQAAVTAASVSMPVPARQKQAALLPTFPFKVVLAGSSGASASSAPSAASAMQVRLLV